MQDGSQGTKPCRIAYMFFKSGERTKVVRKMILTVMPEQGIAAQDLLLPYQRSDFEGTSRAMEGQPVTICSSYPPFQEFLSKSGEVTSLKYENNDIYYITLEGKKVVENSKVPQKVEEGRV